MNKKRRKNERKRKKHYGSCDKSLTEVVDVLAEGYPVIAKVNSSNPHWVVIYKFVGNPAAPVASNFTCADPWTGTSVTLTNATRYSSVGRVVVFR